jgi:hypothetical protein
LAVASSRTAPRITLIHDAVADGSVPVARSWVEAIAIRMPVAPAIPATHPTAKAMPL